MKKLEKNIQEMLFRMFYPCQKEVVTSVGKIDILTPSLLVEIKKSSDWKHAVGQLLAYQTCYPNHQLVLYLFGSLTPQLYCKVKDLCDQSNILLMLQGFEEFPKKVSYQSISIGEKDL